jgi:hypothetical protein
MDTNSTYILNIPESDNNLLRSLVTYLFKQ